MTMKNIILALAFLAIGGQGWCIYDLQTQVQQKTYYDGEGNPLPDKAVKLLVISQFGHLTAEEIQYLDQYIYTRDCWVWVCD